MTLIRALCLITLLLLTASLGSGCSTIGYAASRPPAAEKGDNAATDRSTQEELWIISKASAEQSTAPNVKDPGAGALLARFPNQMNPIPVPLKNTNVKADITGYIATVDVTQQYHNFFTSKIDAVYVFPLPDNAAVNEFVMTIGDRKIRGILRERADAERIYAQAKAQGYIASLLLQDRPNLFTQSIANIEPGKQIDINIKYFHALAYNDGWYEWHFPMAAGPRVNPPAFRTPTFSLSVHLDAGVKIEQLEVPTHRHTARTNDSTATITLAPDDSIPNKDFTLRYRVAGGKINSTVANRDASHTLARSSINPTHQTTPEDLISLGFSLKSRLLWGRTPTGFLAVDATRKAE